MPADAARHIHMRKISSGVRAARFSGVVRTDPKGRLLLLPDGYAPPGTAASAARPGQAEKPYDQAEEPLYFGTPQADSLVAALGRRGVRATWRSAPLQGMSSEVLAVVELDGKEEARVELLKGESVVCCEEETTAELLREALMDQLVEI